MFHEYEITHNGQTMGNWSLMKAKQINLQEWESFGGGGYGESFYNKTDDSVILKLNKTSVSAEKAQEEFRCSKAVYDMGIPSYPAWKAACFWKETKKGSTYSTYKKAAIGDLFACGAYENIWQETIGIFFWHKLLILL